MKIKNVSQQELKIAIPSGNGTGTSTVKPNQVMYCEDKASITKQLVIYQKKRLITIETEIEKPDYVENYRPYYESGTYIPSVKIQQIDLDDEIEETEVDSDVFEPAPLNDLVSENDDDPEMGEPKRGRGRPKKPVTDLPSGTEKKKRGRPKGSTKKTQ